MPVSVVDREEIDKKNVNTIGDLFRTLPGTTVAACGPGRLLTGEQSNTSLVYGRDYVLKTFRRLWPGHNPDLELNMALSGSPYVARPCGWIEADLSGHSAPTTLALLQTFVPDAEDGWVLATENVRTLLDGAEADFSEEAARLGRTTAEDVVEISCHGSPVVLPKGTTLRMRFTYDNSQGTQPVRWGPLSTDEMGAVWLEVVPRRREDAAVLVGAEIRAVGGRFALATYSELKYVGWAS